MHCWQILLSKHNGKLARLNPVSDETWKYRCRQNDTAQPQKPKSPSHKPILAKQTIATSLLTTKPMLKADCFRLLTYQSITPKFLLAAHWGRCPATCVECP